MPSNLGIWRDTLIPQDTITGWNLLLRPGTWGEWRSVYQGYLSSDGDKYQIKNGLTVHHEAGNLADIDCHTVCVALNGFHRSFIDLRQMCSWMNSSNGMHKLVEVAYRSNTNTAAVRYAHLVLLSTSDPSAIE
ncbi:hypothetical protein WG66_001654 [Moniliophthora roreri]|nr:hypothetical protein WG66_001654 [Moniliophthora roreri]